MTGFRGMFFTIRPQGILSCPENTVPEIIMDNGKKEKGLPAAKRRRSGRSEAIIGKRTAAKAGMTASLVALTATGFMKGRGAGTLHIWSGAALIGFSLWHYSLYTKKP